MKENKVLKLGKETVEIPINPIRHARINRNLTQKEMSELLGIPQRTIEDWETRRRKCPEYVEKLVLEKLHRVGESDREQAYWIYHTDELFPAESKQECSNCHEEELYSLCNENYCPNCGAKMKNK